MERDRTDDEVSLEICSDAGPDCCRTGVLDSALVIEVEEVVTQYYTLGSSLSTPGLVETFNFMSMYRKCSGSRLGGLMNKF